MKHLIFLFWLFIFYFPVSSKDIIVEDTIHLIVNNKTEYSKNDYLLTIILPEKYNPKKKRDWRKIKEQLEKMVLEVDLGKTASKSYKTLRYIHKTIVRNKKGVSIKISIANLLTQYYYDKKFFSIEVTKQKILEIKNKGENWRLIRLGG